VIDADGFRANVGIILSNQNGQVMWARRVGQNAWQFPQGGIDPNEHPDQALYRELWEETGLRSSDVEILASTNSWLRYKLPKKMIRQYSHPLCIGQKQLWYLLQLRSDDDALNLSASAKPEFDQWKWVDYWYPLDQVIYFKRRVYQCALMQLESRLPGCVA